MPDNYRSNLSLPSAPPTNFEEESMPKILTVASASTHPAGGPQHAVHEHTDAHTHETSNEDLPAALPSLDTAITSVISGPRRAWKASGLGSSLPEIGMPELKDGGAYKRPDRGLNNEERRGLWVLGGFVGLGLLLNRPGQRKKTARQNVS